MRLRTSTTLLIVLGLAVSACSATPAATAGGAAGGGGGGQASAPARATGGSGGGGGGGSAQIQDPCTLLTPDDIKAQFGVVVAATGASGASTGAASPECSWQPTAITPGFAGVSLTIQKLDQGFFDYTKGAQANHVDVAGLGDGAFFWAPTTPFVLDVKKGDREIILWVAAGGMADKPDQAEKLVVNLANDILGRL